MVKYIELSKGKRALVDDEDFEYLSQFNWFVSSAGYAVRNETVAKYKRRSTLMHRDVLNAKKGLSIDHINGDTLDNRKENLRECTHAQNLKNQKIRSTNTSGYTGVHLVKRRNTWAAKLRMDGRDYCLGEFPDKHDAARMYNFWAADMFGEYARLNVIKEETK